jgi:hypothetical protein
MDGCEVKKNTYRTSVALDSDIEVLEDSVILGTHVLGQPSNQTALEVKDAVNHL